ncbi:MULTISPECIES: hypothetical protein [unclassified Exiguobacterium]|uniref:hypothetical protein n=1 Tax=unclassified Exiguobacterium TaxID=2644629 RepID=UPI002036EB6F|nr:MULTISPECIES: hypothetical protein [unclassified Exiguobacterium]
MTVFGFSGDPFSNSIGDSFFNGLFGVFPIIFMVVFGLIIFAFIKSGMNYSKTSNTLKDLQRFASQLADDPDDDTAERLADYLRGIDSFSIERTRMEPFRVALGCYQLIMESNSIREETKERVDRQYKRLGILDGEKFADEAPPRSRSSSSHHDIHHNHHNHM